MPNIFKYAFLLVASMYFQRGSATERVYFTHLTVEDGLSNSSVLCITQDSRGFMWLGTRDGLNRYDGSRINIYKDFYKYNPTGSNLKINKMIEDQFSNLWIATSHGLYRYDPYKDKFQIVLNVYVNALVEDNNKLWIGTTQGLFMVLLNGNKPVKKNYRIVNPVFANEMAPNVLSLHRNKSGDLLLGTNNGVFVLRQSQKEITISRTGLLVGVNVIDIAADSQNNYWFATNRSGAYKADPELSQIINYVEGTGEKNLLSNNIRKIFVDREGNLWLGTLKGLNRYNVASGGFESWTQAPGDPRSLNYNSIYDIYQDRQNNIWIGTYYGGANIIETVNSNFTMFRNSADANSISSNVVSGILGDEKGNLWVGTEAEGLNYFDLKINHITRFRASNQPDALGSNLVKTVFRDHNKDLWIGLYGGGVNKKLGRGGFVRFNTANSGLNSNNVTSIAEDANGNLWIGHQESGINIFDRDRKRIRHYSEFYQKHVLTDSAITCLFFDSGNKMWIGTRMGLNYIEFGSDGKTALKKSFPGPIGHEYINCVVEDRERNIWIGSSSGLTRYNSNTEQFSVYTVTSGLPGNKVVGIVADDKNNLWVSTNNGLAGFDPRAERFISYGTDDGLAGKAFNYNSFFRDSGGSVFFGSYSGLVAFNPREVLVNESAPDLILTGLFVNGQSINAGSRILKNDITVTNELQLKYHEANLSIEYAVLNYIKPAKNLSAYKLEGHDMDWVLPGVKRADFVNLQPGRYPLFLKGANNDGVWSPAQKILTITVMPPFWQTWWAYVLYVVAATSIVAGVFYFINSRATIKRELLYEHELNERQRELQKMKTDFFTHMSHELRTPLTLILGPAEMLLENVEKTRDEKMLGSIKSNAERLLNLTNRLMTFMKADSGALKLNLQTGDIVPLVVEVFEKFRLQAGNKNISYKLSGNEAPVHAIHDRHYLEIVITNLLSNAIKFTPPGGEVKLEIINNYEIVEVAVCDNGPGIDEEDAGKIFTQFFQTPSITGKTEGFGVGLALSKKLMLLHEGELQFTSFKDGENKKTCFILSLKKGNLTGSLS